MRHAGGAFTRTSVPPHHTSTHLLASEERHRLVRLQRHHAAALAVAQCEAHPGCGGSGAQGRQQRGVGLGLGLGGSRARMQGRPQAAGCKAGAAPLPPPGAGGLTAGQGDEKGAAPWSGQRRLLALRLSDLRTHPGPQKEPMAANTQARRRAAAAAAGARGRLQRRPRRSACGGLTGRRWITKPCPPSCVTPRPILVCHRNATPAAVGSALRRRAGGLGDVGGQARRRLPACSTHDGQAARAHLRTASACAPSASASLATRATAAATSLAARR